ncbi:MAG: hypothetical protein J7507_12485 [Pseudoxanthomonas sp.]|nr:hypothetical protein [Pseudoxanthomonas sp.]
MHRKLLIGTWVAAIGTLAFYATGVDWSWAHATHNLGSSTLAYLVTAAFGLLPYGLLAILISRSSQSPVFRLLSFVLVVALAICAFGWLRLQGIRTDGWDFVLVPVWQLILIATLWGLRKATLSFVRWWNGGAVAP